VELRLQTHTMHVLYKKELGQMASPALQKECERMKFRGKALQPQHSSTSLSANRLLGLNTLSSTPEWR
jgi:hypothetical protein